MPSLPAGKRRWRALVLGLLAAIATELPAADMAEVPAPIAKQLRLHKIAVEDVSLYVHGVDDPHPLLSINAEVPRNPASTIKLLTTLAGLDILGPEFVWRTRAYITGTLADGRLDGDLVLQGQGDPALTPEALWRFLRGVRERGVEIIGGDVILDGSYFEPLGDARGDFDGHAASAYNAIPTALSVNFQTTRIHLIRDDSSANIRVFTDPPLANLGVENQIKLVEAPCQRKFHKPRVSVVEGQGSATLKLSGTFASQCREESYPRLILDPADHAAGAVAALWRELGGSIEGEIRAGERPQGAKLLYTLESPPLEEVIREINKQSNNLMARTLLLTLGAERRGAPGSLAKAQEAVADWLSEKGLDLPELVLDNGAGLSRVTRIAAASMGRLLGYAYSSPIMPEFLSSLAIAGVDGTMRKRFKKGPLAGRGHLKTGTLRGATGIAGFLLDKDGRRWIVVSLINNPRLQAWRGKGVENTLLQWVYEEAGAISRGTGTTAEPGPPDWFLHAANTSR